MTPRSRPNLRRGKLAETTPRNCRYCDVPLVVRPRTGSKLPRNRHCGLGLCSHCYTRRERLKWAEKDPPRKPATRWRALDILAEWEHLRATEKLTSRDVARRLGITYEHMDRSLCRARIYRKRDAHIAQAQREREALEAAVYWAEVDAHRINDDMIAYALRKAG